MELLYAIIAVLTLACVVFLVLWIRERGERGRFARDAQRDGDDSESRCSRSPGLSRVWHG